jgi:hypothetical protein
MVMKTLALFALLLVADPTWHCPGCKKNVPASEVKFGLCQEPHDKIVHVKDCRAFRHTCKAEVKPVIAAPIKAENPGVNSEKAGIFVATDAEAVLKGKPGLEAGKTAHLYVLLGGSGSGADPLRASRARVDYDAKTKTVRVIITSVVWKHPPEVGTADYCYVGWRFELGKLEAGDVKVVVFNEVETAEKPGAKPTSTTEPDFTRDLTFSVK